MKSFRLKRNKAFVTVALVLMTATPLFAQSNTNRNDNVRTETTRVVEQDKSTDWGWLGLLGLLGLTGLLPKKRSIEVKGVRDTTENRSL